LTQRAREAAGDEKATGETDRTAIGRVGLPRHRRRLSLYLVGESDFLISSEQRAQIESALRANGVRHEVVTYAEAPHAFLAPGDPVESVASRDAWNRMLNALAAELRCPRPGDRRQSGQ
jgi:acetyl esterase/lipase